MKRPVLRWIAAAIISVGLCSGHGAAQESVEGVYIIFDASGSMWGRLPDGTHKIQAARDVLKEFVAGDFSDKALALRAYGHNREGDCADTELVVPFAAPTDVTVRIQQFADNVNPKGKTPIRRSLRAALDDFGNRPGEIILISDGIETCDEDPCELVRAWRDSGIRIKVHVVGLGLNEKEQAAMECISEAAGTEYHDAQSASELSVGLRKIQQRSGWSALSIRATASSGEAMFVHGTATVEGGEAIEVRSNLNNRVPAGKNLVTVGVRTRNGNLYEPVTRTVQVAQAGQTVLDVVVNEPPSVKTKFVDRGNEARGSNVTAYQDGAEVFAFRWLDRTYLDPGTYEFRAKPNPENELSVTESFADGEHKDVVFELVHTVLARIKVVAAGSGIDFRENYELWQDGKLIEKVHWVNGARALPGIYELRLVNPLTPFRHPGLVLTGDDEQDFRIEVPVGHVQVLYRKADETPDEDARCWIERWDGERWIGNKTQRSGTEIPLLPGKHRVKGWNHGGKSYDDVELTVTVGAVHQAVLRNKN